MAASIYATPPPDLSNEDTALSDVSNTSAAATTTTTTNNNASTTLKTQHSTTTITSPAATSSSSSSAAAATLTNNNKINSSSSSTSGSSSSHNQFPEQHSIADASLKNPKPPTTTQCSSNQPSFVGNPTNNVTDNEDSVNANDNNEQQTTTTTTAATATATAMAAMQLQLLEAINDAAKKRRKQHNPSRMEDEEEQDEESDSPRDPSIDYEDKLSKMLLPKSMEQLKETFEYLQQQQQHHHHQQQQQQHLENISKTQEHNKSKQEDQPKQHQQQQQQQQQQLEQSFNNPYHTFCKECGENFENEFKLSLHMLQEHNDSCETFSQNQPTIGDMSALDILASVKVKLERPECESPSSNHIVEQPSYTNDHVLQNTGSSTGLTNGKGQQQHTQTQQSQQQPPWLAAGGMPPMGFPFPPEAAAAAALQAGGYLPLLAVPGFPGVDGLSRPPLRIFNPEAFCELCNKEFCNKYFLKTHKANKHGIYDPSTEGLSGQQQQQQQQSNMNAMNQMFQMQMQHQHQQQMQLELAQQQQKLLNSEQQQSKGHETSTSTSTTTATITSGTNKTSQTSVNSQTNTPPTAPQPVFCDICSKRFTNVFAMRRHRAKLHEQSSNNTSQRNSPSESSNSSVMESNVSNNDVPAFKQFQMPEGFRQDYVLEQEEVSFTPQPRKLSPQSQQQAREANFSHDKLKRLGVLNPDAFCEICCKEYCNKYFLRTHKWKRHGIFMPPEESENLQKLPTWPFMNMPGMPVNLMMAQRMMTASQEMPTEELQPSKRIKLEKPDEDELPRESHQDENQENRSENNQASSPELNKLINDHQHSETSMGLQNLQKLQTMIQQLNDLNGKRPVNCHLCGRELENQYALQAHIMAEHAGTMEGSMAPLNFPSHLLMHQQALLKQSPNGSPTSLMPLMGMPGAGELRCNPCDREFNSLPEFQKHIADVHLLSSSSGSPLREGFLTPERPINTPLGQGTRPPYTITPTSSYCEICNKELCNKYFMKTHMQRMHGIEIENGAQIGGVVCNICNKELCSKYFLRVHKHNTHGIIEDGAPLPQPRQNGLNLDSALQQQMMETESMNRNLNISPFGSAGSEGKAEAYTPPSSYSEACSLCSRRFRNSKWLRSHLLSDHGATGLEKVREMDQQFGASISKPSSPTLKIPNGASSSGSASATPTAVPSPAQLAQALQNLNAQHLIKNNMTGSFTSEQNLQSPQLKEYQCSTCPFTTPYYAFLFIHERTHSILNNNEHEQEQEQEHEMEQEQEQEQELETVEQEKEQKANIVEEETERKVAKRKTNRDTKTPLEVIKVDQDEQDANMDEKFLMSNETEPTNLSMRTPSPTEITSTTSRGEVENKTNSPKANVASDIGRSLSVSPQQQGLTNTAQSPVFNNHMPSQQQQLQEMAQQTGKIATFAMPRLVKNDANNEAPHMQAFVMEAAEEHNEDAERFVPAIVYLPVRERLTGTTMKLSFKLTPV